MRSKKMFATMVLSLVLMVCLPARVKAGPMGTAWTYQGQLIDANEPADGLYDLQFKLFNEPIDGNQISSTIDINDLDIIEGYLTVALDFGSGVFNGNSAWLDIGIRPGESEDEYTPLSTRQEITPVPYALYAEKAGTLNVPLELTGTTILPEDALLEVRNNGNGHGLFGYSLNNYGVYGNSHFLVGVAGSSHSNMAVYGVNISYSNYGYLADNNYGVYGKAMRSTAKAIHGVHNISGNYGTLGSSQDGVYGLSSTSGGSGVAGIHNGSGNGIYGRSTTGFAGYFSGDVHVSENVGIGTTSPDTTLHIKHKSNTDHFQLKIANPNGGGNNIAHAGILFHVEDDKADRGKGGIMFESIGNWNRGKLHFLQNNTKDASQATLANSVMTIQNDGNVGIGTTNPSQKLEVNGNVKITGDLEVGGSIAPTTKTSYYTVPAAAFIPGHLNLSLVPINYTNSGERLSNESAVDEHFVAPVNLPHGAWVVKVTSYWVDQSPEDATLRLRARLLSGGNPLYMAEMTTSWNDAASQVRLTYDDTVEHNTINNFNYMYYLRVYMPADDNLKCLAVRIEYTITE